MLTKEQLIDKAEEIYWCVEHGDMDKAASAILAAMPEPLAVLADRKGCSIVCRRHELNSGDEMGISIFGERAKSLGQVRFDYPTYAAAEQAAREYLEALPDQNKGE